MDLRQQQNNTRNSITPRTVRQLPLSISAENYSPEDQEVLEWVRSTNDHQFWAYHYKEHMELVTLALPLEPQWTSFIERANDYQQYWSQMYEALISDDEMVIPLEYLEDFREFKLELLRAVLNTNEWKGWAPPTVYEHMIREVEYIMEPKNSLKVIMFWLTDMEGHAALDVSGTDPAHASLVKKAREFKDAFVDLKKNMGISEEQGLVDLLERKYSNEIPPPPMNENGDLRELLTRLVVLQNALTTFNIEYKHLTDANVIFSTMPPTLIAHTLRESMRASYELGALVEGRIIQ